MAKKNLNSPEEGNKNIGRGIGSLLSGPKKKEEKPQKEKKESEKIEIGKFDTVDVVPYSLRIPGYMFEKLKYDLSKELKSNMRDLILTAIREKYDIKAPEEQ